MKKSKIRPIIEILSILFLLYTNLLMGQFLRTSSTIDGQSSWITMMDIVTPQNFFIGLVGAAIGFLLVESVNRK